MKLLILNGPNLNMLGIREPDIYGSRSFSALEDFIRETCREEDIDCTLFQSNYEGALVEKIQEAYDHDGLIMWNSQKKQTWSATAYLRLVLRGIMGFTEPARRSSASLCRSSVGYILCLSCTSCDYTVFPITLVELLSSSIF